MNRNELEQWLSSVKVLTDDDITSEMQQQLEALIGPGMKAFLGLLLGSRQAFYAQLSAISLGTPEQAARASVIQGKIQGIDLVRQSLLDLAITADADDQGA